MVKKTDAIRNFLEAKTHPDLSSLYNYEMEVQVNVARDNGEKVTGEYNGVQWTGWTDGEQLWKNFRIPYNAWKNPSYQDKDIKFSLEMHAEGIGMTGWNWVQQKSVWVVFDVDSIIGHNTGLYDDQLEQIKNKCLELPWVTIRRSTSGNGFHLYVFFDEPVSTETHTEHSALARAVLTRMSQEVGFDFHASVDICGGNAWVWHRKLDQSNGTGLSLVRAATVAISAPNDWRDHLNVMGKRRSRPAPEGASESMYKLMGANARVPLDHEHKALLEYLENNTTCYYYFQPENNMLVTHTVHLKEAHQALGLKGDFETISTGKDYGQDKNCFAFPMKHGVWVVRRFSPGVTEHPLWDTDPNGYARIYYNASWSMGGAVAKKGKKLGVTNGKTRYGVTTADLDTIFKNVGLPVPEVPEHLSDRPMEVVLDPANRLTTFRIRAAKDDPELPNGDWTYHRKNYELTVSDSEYSGGQESVDDATLVVDYDDQIRYVVQNGTGWGTGTYYSYSEHNGWSQLETTLLWPAFRRLFGNSAELAMMACKDNPWFQIMEPFKEEYPGDRRWNMYAPKYAFEPQDGPTPTWDMVYDHIGTSLGDALAEDEWAVANSVHTGRDYLYLWVASLLRYPELPLPYLFFGGPERGGKSLFHESISLLVTGGVVEATGALTKNFNGELDGAVLCYIEEVDLSKERESFNRIKKFVTQKTLTIDAKFMNPYQRPNRTHWVQCANNMNYLPIFPGDTRVVVIDVPEVEAEKAIPKQELLDRLEQEAPCFLGKLLSMTIPPCRDRLRIPAIYTEVKELLENERRTPIEVFLSDNCLESPGSCIALPDLLERYNEVAERPLSSIRFAAKLPRTFPRGILSSDPARRTYVGNLRWIGEPEPTDKRVWERHNSYLRRAENH